MAPYMSVLIPWYERDEIALTLAANEPSFSARDIEIIVINCSGSSDHLSELIAASGLQSVRQLDICNTCFNKSLALNIGLRYARAPLVLTLDADIIVLSDGFAEMINWIDEKSFVTTEWVYESDQRPAESEIFTSLAMVNDFTTRLVATAVLDFSFRDGTTVCHQLSRRDLVDGLRAGPGLLLARKADLIAIQAYNSNLDGWGWEDDDVLLRLQHVLGLRRHQKGIALHLSHGDDRRILHRKNRRLSDRANFAACCRNYNDNVFVGTYVTDVSAPLEQVAESSKSNLGPASRPNDALPLVSGG